LHEADLTTNDDSDEDIAFVITKQAFINLSLLLPWRISPVHLRETRMAVYPKPPQKVLIKELGINVKMEKFNKLKDAQINKNWHDFCKLSEALLKILALM
jgi:hypothetical protein